MSYALEPRVEADGRNQRTGTNAKVKNDVHQADQAHQHERGSIGSLYVRYGGGWWVVTGHWPGTGCECEV